VIAPWLLELRVSALSRRAHRTIHRVGGRFLQPSTRSSPTSICCGPAIAGWSRSRTRSGASASGTHRSFARPTASTWTRARPP